MKTTEELTELFIEALHKNPEIQVEEFLDQYLNEEVEEVHSKQKQDLLEILPLIQLLEQGKDNIRDVNACTFSAVGFPEKISGFLLERELGRGGMGVVFQAKQESLNRLVAIKILSPNLGFNQERHRLFEKEAQIIANLHHPHIIQVFGSGHDAHYSFYAMEMIKGAPLDCTQPHLRKEVARLGVQMASALAYAHSKNILHRDVKPGNILIDAHNEAHLGDFGLATYLDDKNALTVTEHSREGTIRYMAPEIFLNNQFSFAADQYAFGVTLYEYYTGTPLFSSLSSAQTIQYICENRLSYLLEKNDDFAVIINKCLAFRPQDRYSSMKEVENDLRRFLNSEPIQARKNTIIHKLTLWYIRKPLLATFILLTVFLTLSLLTLSSVGYFIVSNSLKNEAYQRQLAEENARIAQRTLERIYKKDVYDKEVLLPPSQATTSLLNDLLPYYESICKVNMEQSPQRLAEIQKDLGLMALNARKYKMAETMFRKAASLFSEKSFQHYFCLNQQGVALEKQGEKNAAQETWNRIIKEVPLSTESKTKSLTMSTESSQKLLEVAIALQNWANMLKNEGYKGLKGEENPSNLGFKIKEIYRKSYAVLKQIDPTFQQTSEYQFTYATLLMNDPNLISSNNLKDNPFDILASLVCQEPQNKKFHYQLIRASLNLNLKKRFYVENSKRLEQSLSSVEFLLADGNVDASLIDATTNLYEKYIDSLHNRRESINQSNRIIGIMKVLASGQNHPEKAKEAALRFLLKQYQFLAQSKTQTPNNGANKLKDEIQEIIDDYSGNKKNDFERQFREISEKTS